MKNVIDFLKNVGRVKKIKRAGWVREGIAGCESVADHSFRVAVAAMVFGGKLGADTNKLIKMALVHDIAEGVAGDKVVERGEKIDNSARDKKNAEEIEILRQIFADIPDNNDFVKLQREIIDNKTHEAKIFKQLERLEMAVQALEYEEEYGKDLSEFFDNAAIHINHPYLKKLLEEIKKSRVIYRNASSKNP